MSKRFFPQQPGERKKAKLDITISDHNFPLSQNAAANDDLDNWGDDNDDEILLMASQACEQAYGNNSTLPDFSLCMQPGATSTQMFPQPGSSKEFTFKKPTMNSPHLTSTHLKDKCNRISSPLPGMSSKVISNGETMKYNDDLIYNDKVYKGQDPDHVYRQLLQLQEENAKLKSENGKLMDKCVTKEGEASILRTQLKSCQVAVDNARIEKIKGQEKVQMEWTDKLAAVNGQMHDLRTQLDFKNLEIISIKEKCRMLESTKVKLTQVTVPNNDISTSHRHNNMSNHNLSLTQKKVKMSSTAAQTNSKAHFLRLYKSHHSATPNLTSILPSVLEPTAEQPSLLDFSEKLHDLDQSQHPCRVFSTFHRVPATVSKPRDGKMIIGCIHEDLTSIADGVNVAEKFDKILKATSAVLAQLQQQLKEVESRATSAFLRDMDQRYVDATGAWLAVPRRRLLSGSALYKEEQGILPRRMVATVAFLLQRSTNIVTEELVKNITDNANDGILQVLSDVCSLLDTTSCATLYNGLLYATAILLQSLPTPLPLLKSLISCRPAPTVSCQLLRVLRHLAVLEGGICGGSGNMRMDLEQGVLLYKKDSCHLHVILKQIEVALKCIERQKLVAEAVTTTQDLLGFYSNYTRHTPRENRCDCQLVLMQVLVSALRLCSLMLKAWSSKDVNLSSELLSACRAGALLLARAGGAGGAELGAAEGAAADFVDAVRGRCQPAVLALVAGGAELGAAEGAAADFVDAVRGRCQPAVLENMLIELAGTFQCAAEDSSPSYHRHAWIKSFDAFSLAD